MNLIKESLSEHKAISLHLCAIIRDEQLYIFEDYAEFGDLETFLYGGLTADRDFRYDFNERFPRCPVDGLFTQMNNLASALDHLHERLEIPDFPNVRCAHLDLTPRNILIFRSKSSEVGNWKISDFGISTIHKKATGRDLQTIGDIVRSKDESSRHTLKTRQGQYAAPELDSGNATKLGSEQRPDIWSYAAIFHEVVAFAIGGSDCIRNFQHERGSNRQDDYFFQRATEDELQGETDILKCRTGRISTSCLEESGTGLRTSK